MQEKERHTIVGVHITDRIQEAIEVQKALTKYGHQIKTRLGLHEIAEKESAPNGLLLLEMVGPEDGITALMKTLNGIEGVEAKKVVFEHPAP